MAVELITALALVLVIEGAIYALFPEGMQRMMMHAIEMDPGVLRYAGLGLAVFGVLMVWLIRG